MVAPDKFLILGLSRSRVVKCLIERGQFSRQRLARRAFGSPNPRRPRPHCGVSPRAEAWRDQPRDAGQGGMRMPQVIRYHPVLVALHWMLALLIIAALALGAL